MFMTITDGDYTELRVPTCVLFEACETRMPDAFSPRTTVTGVTPQPELKSAALYLGARSLRPRVPAPHRHKGVGQECPTHTVSLGLTVNSSGRSVSRSEISPFSTQHQSPFSSVVFSERKRRTALAYWERITTTSLLVGRVSTWNWSKSRMGR